MDFCTFWRFGRGKEGSQRLTRVPSLCPQRKDCCHLRWNEQFGIQEKSRPPEERRLNAQTIGELFPNSQNRYSNTGQDSTQLN